MAKEKPRVTMSATNTKGGKVETNVNADGNATRTESGDTTGIHQTTGSQVIRDDEVIREF